MAFASKDGNKVSGNKQRLNLSPLAQQIVAYDMFAFRETRLSTFINRVFEQFYPAADASISRMLNQLDGKLNKLLADFPIDEQVRKRLIHKLLSQKKGELTQKAALYENGESILITLNKNNFEYLTGQNVECQEEKYYPRLSKYLKCVIEEYARLPYIEREKIYFRPFIDEIQAAIQKEKQLKIVTQQDKVYSVSPYKIMCDPLSTVNYLVGYSNRYTEPEEEKRPCSLKISALKSVRMESSKSAFMKKSVQKQLSQTIASRGVQFMIGSEAEIRVRLSEEGIRKYHRFGHLRPAPAKEPEGNIFTFQCTIGQAEFYFFKFGKDAEILAPQELRTRFIKLYQDALDTYTSPPQKTVD